MSLWRCPDGSGHRGGCGTRPPDPLAAGPCANASANPLPRPGGVRALVEESRRWAGADPEGALDLAERTTDSTARAQTVAAVADLVGGAGLDLPQTTALLLRAIRLNQGHWAECLRVADVLLRAVPSTDLATAILSAGEW
jgi:hypothetical protein